MLATFSRRRCLWTLTTIILVGGMAVWCWWMTRKPAIPTEYQEIRLGMSLNEVEAVLLGGPFKTNVGPGYSGRQEDEQHVPGPHLELSYRIWRDEVWSISVMVDPSNTVMMKSLVLIDRNEFSFFRNPLLWIRRKFFPSPLRDLSGSRQNRALSCRLPRSPSPLLGRT